MRPTVQGYGGKGVFGRLVKLAGARATVIRGQGCLSPPLLGYLLSALP